MAQPRPSAGRHRVRLGHGALANFLCAVAEACSPQRFREENAVVRFISRALEPGDMYTSVFVYTTASVTSALATPRADLRFTGVAAIRLLVEKGQ